MLLIKIKGLKNHKGANFYKMCLNLYLFLVNPTF